MEPVLLKKRLQDIVKNERGAFNPIEGLFLITIIGVIAAIVIPPVVNFFEKRPAAKDEACIKTMIAELREERKSVFL